MCSKNIVSRNIVRMRFSGRFWTVLLIAAFVCISAVAEGATLTVGTCPGAGFPTIQSAVNAAHSGDIVDVCPGAYPEQVSINKSLTLEGIAVTGQDAAVTPSLPRRRTACECNRSHDGNIGSRAGSRDAGTRSQSTERQ